MGPAALSDLTADPSLPASFYAVLGQRFVGAGRLDEARRAYELALARDATHAAALTGLARVMHAVGDTRGAIDVWGRLVALGGGGAWEAENNLGAAWMELREWERADGCFARAGRAGGDPPVVLVNRATLAQHLGRRAEAVALYEASVAKHPDHAAGHAGLGFALRDEGRWPEAAAALRRARQLAPENATYACGLARVHLEAGDAARASAEARAFLAQRPGHAGALNVEALARFALGDAPGGARLLDFERFVSARRLAAPAGFRDLARFNEALAAHAARHPTLVAAPVSHATADGLHSGSLLVEPRGPIGPFEQAVAAAVAAYGRALPTSGPHPFVDHRPRRAFLKMWCVVLERGGHQRPHIHPASWLSGVYYARLPPALRAPAGAHDPAGGLEFGRPDRPFPAVLPPPLFHVRPEEGLLVLFPSYFFHRTVPFDADGTRVSVAFDVAPV
jgi:tetratricopeptide (TPR) repeat protein